MKNTKQCAYGALYDHNTKKNKCGVNNYIILEWQIRKSLKSKESLLWSILTLHKNSTRFDQSRVII
jgi:hypothetical protein